MPQLELVLLGLTTQLLRPGSAEEVALLDGILGVGWPSLLEGGSNIQDLLKLERELDPRRAQYYGESGEREGNSEEEAAEENREEDEHTHNFQLHQPLFHFQFGGTAGSDEYARLTERMGEEILPHQFLIKQQQQQQERRRGSQQSRLGGPRGGGEIVEVQGGHIVRATGRKDRHSKVCTAKGPRDRRVRLAAHTAIQFYDVQDRLGYDRPSKAVDWLIMNAKSAIDELAQLPAWHPTNTAAIPPVPSEDSSKRPMSADEPATFSFGAGGDSNINTSFLPPSLDSDVIADTIKSFFPIAATAPSSPPPIGYQNYPPPPDLLSRTSSQDLRLSLQSFQDPIFDHAAHHQHHLAFDSSGWPDQSQRMTMVPWNLAESDSGSRGYMFNVPPPPPPPPQHHHHHQMHGQGQLFTQRGPLQSSNSPSVRAWADPMPPPPAMHTSLHSPIGFASGSSSSFSGFRIPARIQGEEKHNGGISDKPSSGSSASHH